MKERKSHIFYAKYIVNFSQLVSIRLFIPASTCIFRAYSATDISDNWLLSNGGFASIIYIGL